MDHHEIDIGPLTLRPTDTRQRRAYVMGILNVTPDSFSDGGRFLSVDDAVRRAAEVVAEGADIIDIGGASSRPRGTTYGDGASVLSPEAECDRVIPVIENLVKEFPQTALSIDTYHSLVAHEALNAGVHLVNDITALRHDSNMAGVIKQNGAPIVLMHSVGSPGTMPHESLEYQVEEIVADELSKAISVAVDAGVQNILVDPGFGFGKTHIGNFRLLRNLGYLRKLNRPILVGVSRKAMIGQAVGTIDNPVPTDKRVTGSLAAAVIAVTNGASIIRTHDIAPTVEALRILHATNRTANATNRNPA